MPQSNHAFEIQENRYWLLIRPICLAGAQTKLLLSSPPYNFDCPIFYDRIGQ